MQARATARCWEVGQAARIVARLVLPLSLLAVAAHGQSGPELDLYAPESGQAVESYADVVVVRGRVAPYTSRAMTSDWMIVIDSSGSTSDASGADIDGDGRVGRTAFLPSLNTDHQDSILHAEVAAARQLLEVLDPGRTRVGLISFSGGGEAIAPRGDSILMGRGVAPPAVLHTPLTRDYREVQDGLHAILQEGSHDNTDFSAALRLAAKSFAPGPEPTLRFIAFLTDGYPTDGSSKVAPSFVVAAEAAAIELAEAGVQVHVLALGPTALSRPAAATAIARRTGGSFNPVLDLAQLGSALPFLVRDAERTAREQVAVYVSSADRGLTRAQVLPNGTFVAMAPIEPGINRIEILAVAADGATTSVERSIEVSLPEIAAEPGPLFP